MTMRYDQVRKRIICRWEEPVRIVMNKLKAKMKRTRMITVKVNDSGSLSRKDVIRHEDHPMFPTIKRFNALLNDLRSEEKQFGHTCSVCDRDHDVCPHFDIETKSIVWLCREHLNQSPKVNA